MTRFSLITTSQRIRVALVLVLLMISVVQFMPRVVKAADGDLDATFGNGDPSVPAGVARTFFGANSSATNDNVVALGIQSTGKIIAAGFTNFAFALTRYNTNGTLDTTFGTMGKVTTTFLGQGSADLAVDPGTDKLVAVGSAQAAAVPMAFCSQSNVDIAIARYNADGSLDTSFNTTGQLTIDFFGCTDRGFAVVIQPDHKIVVVGSARQEDGMGFVAAYTVLVRLNSDGTFDSTFNGGVVANTSGKVTHNFATTGLGFQADMVRVPSGPHAGKFITVGTAQTGDFQVARFNVDGSLDLTFGPANTGQISTSFGAGISSEASAVVIQPDDKIIATGDVNNGTSFATARYDNDGNLDSMFGTGGKLITAFPAPANRGSARFVGVMPNNKIILSGPVSGSDFTLNIGIARYNTNGTFDTTFGNMGTVLTHLGQNPNGGGPGNPRDNAAVPQAGALQADGKILVAGSINTSGQSDSDFFVARFSNGLDCTINCPANKTQSNDLNQCGAVVTYANPSETGTQCGGGVMCSPASGSFFPVGTTTVNCSDSAGPTCSFTVTVNDTQNPTITCPSNITVPGSSCQNVSYTTPTPSDNCSGATASCLPASGSCFAVGTTTVTCTAKDAAMNMATCTFTVTISNCTITCPANITTGTGPGASQCCAVVTYPAPTTTGACGTVTCSPASGSCFAVGTTTVNCSTTSGPSCSFTVSVTDTTPPTITCPANKTAKTATINDSCTVVSFATTASDNCPGVTVGCLPPSGTCFPVGTTTVSCTATDASNNTATCAFTVTVFNVCIQDDSNSSTVFLANATTGAYRFCCGGTTFTGLAQVTRRGNVATFTDNTSGRRVQASDDESVFKGTASIQSPPGTIKCTITDRDTRNNSCICQ
jgi:uncharacterized delta-60 repeat protein